MDAFLDGTGQGERRPSSGQTLAGGVYYALCLVLRASGLIKRDLRTYIPA